MSDSSSYTQQTLFGAAGRQISRAVNVASVPQRSPFRYPGGKTWLVPQIRKWLTSLDRRPAVLVEPFAGGATAGLTAAFEDLADRVVLVELDAQVASVWQTILGHDSEWLVRRILGFEISPESVQDALSQPVRSRRELAFQTLLRNRTYHGGILAPGSGVIKTGENGKGIRSRWYPQTLARRIRSVSLIRDRIAFIEGDGFDVIREWSRRKRAVFFVDPPYTASVKKAGRRLYAHCDVDHGRLFSLMEKVAGEFLMTYDEDSFVHELVLRHGFECRSVLMNNTHHATLRELLISRRLSWA